MTESYFTCLTAAGGAAFANAPITGKPVDFATIAVGDGSGSYSSMTYAEMRTRSGLINEVWRGSINHITNDDVNSNWIIMETLIPSVDGDFEIREVGAFNADGVLLAIGKYPLTYKPKLDQGAAKDLYIKMILEVTDTGMVELKVDPTIVMASRQHVADELEPSLWTRSQKQGTTPGRPWSEEVNIIQADANGLERYNATKPKGLSKRIVILGSSFAEGVGASSTANSWARIFATEMEARGFTVINRSISGTKTQISIDRFYRDVAPYEPDFVFHATALWNEGFSANPETIYHTYANNVKTLTRMTESINAIPVFIGPYPKDTAGLSNYKILKQLYHELELSGVQSFNFLGPLDSGSGTFIEGLASDGTHPNDTGHAAVANAIPHTYFEAAIIGRNKMVNLQTGFRKGFYQREEPAEDYTGSTYQVIEIDVDNNRALVPRKVGAESWSLVLDMKCNESHGKTFAGARDRTARLRGAPDGDGIGNFQAVAGQGENEVYITSNIGTADNSRHIHTLSFQALTRTFSYYIDGLLIGSEVLDPSILTSVQYAQFLGRTAYPAKTTCPYNTELYEYMFYRSPLSINQIQSIMSGYVPRSSLEAWGKADAPVSGKLTNYADTLTPSCITNWVAGEEQLKFQY